MGISNRVVYYTRTSTKGFLYTNTLGLTRLVRLGANRLFWLVARSAVLAQDASRFATHYDSLRNHGQQHYDEQAKRDASWTHGIDCRMRRTLPQMRVVHRLIDSVVNIVAYRYGFSKSRCHSLAHPLFNRRRDFHKALCAPHCAMSVR